MIMPLPPFKYISKFLSMFISFKFKASHKIPLPKSQVEVFIVCVVTFVKPLLMIVNNGFYPWGLCKGSKEYFNKQMKIKTQQNLLIKL